MINYCLISGAGLYAARSDRSISSGPIANNGVIVSSSYALRLECISNSSMAGVGSIITSNGTIISPGTFTSPWFFTDPFSRPGALRLRLISDKLRSSHQGIYTCTIPDDNGNIISLNVGLYPHGFNGETLQL